jgi:hypothetical protein
MINPEMGDVSERGENWHPQISESNPQVDVEATIDQSLQYVDKMTAERKGEEYVTPPTEEELIMAGLEPAVRVVTEERDDVDTKEAGTEVIEEVGKEVAPSKNDTEDETLFQKVRNNVV